MVVHILSQLPKFSISNHFDKNSTTINKPKQTLSRYFFCGSLGPKLSLTVNMKCQMRKYLHYMAPPAPDSKRHNARWRSAVHELFWLWRLYVHFLRSFGTLKFYECTLTGVWVLICYSSTAHNMLCILFIFSRAIELSWGKNSIDYGVTLLIK